MSNDAGTLTSGAGSPRIEYREMESHDLEFLYQVYASTRTEEMALMQWSLPEVSQFLRSQFHAQHTFYQDQFKGAEFQIILVDGVRAGRLYRHRRKEEMRVIDITLLPEFRGHGIGGFIMKSILAKSEKLGLVTRIHVEQFNPALRLYLRLGFKLLDRNNIYNLMEHLPQGQCH